MSKPIVSVQVIKNDMVMSKIFLRAKALRQPGFSYETINPSGRGKIKVAEKYSHTGKITLSLRHNNAKEKQKLYITEIIYVHVSKYGKLETCRSMSNKAVGVVLCI